MAQTELNTFWKAAQLRDKIIIVIGLLYVISPLDIIPEVILGPLGLLDDGGALFAVVLTMWRVLKRLQTQKQSVIEGEEVTPRSDR